MRFTVVGGMNLDVRGEPLHGFSLRDSNIGRVVFNPGGVGRNIAECLARMGGQVNLVTAIGHDENARYLRNSCKAAGISLSGSLTVDLPTSVYLCIHDERGDMLAAINDMRIMDMLTPEHISHLLPNINRSSVCILDANVPEETLSLVAAQAHIPLLLDPVSCAKAAKAVSALPRIEAIKPNLLEALALSGKETPYDAAAWFLSKGVKRIFISLGADGVYFADAGICGIHPAVSVQHCIQTGAGDAMCAGIALALARGRNTAECAGEGCRRAAEYLNDLIQEDLIYE